MSQRATTEVVCDGHVPPGSKTINLPLDRHTDDPVDLPAPWHHIDIAITGAGHRTFEVCSSGCGERVLIELVREAFGHPRAEMSG